MVAPPAVFGPTRVIGLFYLSGVPLPAELSDHYPQKVIRPFHPADQRKLIGRMCYETMCLHDMQGMLSDSKFFCLRFAFVPIVSYNIGRHKRLAQRGKTMDYQTFLNDAASWMFSDITHVLYVVAGIAVVGAINGIRLSLNRCKGPYNGRIL